MSEESGFDLNLEFYCAYCKDFTADVESVEVTTCGDKFPKYRHVIACENACKCKLIYERMNKL